MGHLSEGRRRFFAAKLPWLAILTLLAAAVALRFGFTACDYIAYTIAGIALVWAAFRLLRILGGKHPLAARRLRRVLLAALVLFGVWFGGTEVYLITGAGGNPSTACDYVVVLGAQVRQTTPSRSLKDRIQAATAWLESHEDAICIVSGGQGPGEAITEADCMASMLVENGIDPQRIWREEQAANTKENIVYSAELIEARTGEKPAQLALLSSEYHLRRAHLTAARQGIDAVCVAAPTSLVYVKVNYFIREAFGFWYYWLLE